MAITIDHDLLDLMPSTVTIERWTGYDEYGQREYGTPFQVQCRIEGRVRKIVAIDGQERVSMATIYLAESPGLSPNDRITLAGYTPPQPNVLAIEKQNDENGPYYEAIFTT